MKSRIVECHLYGRSIAAFKTTPKTSNPTHVRSFVSSFVKPSSQGPITAYHQLVAEQKIRYDPHQVSTIQLLQNLHSSLVGSEQAPPIMCLDKVASKAELVRTPPLSTSLFPFFSSQPPTPTSAPPPEPTFHYGLKGLYLHGGVGTGKSMVMDLFYSSLPPTSRKKRFHFHEFMQHVHRQNHALKQKHGMQFQAIPVIAQQVINEAWILCFDELQVTDIADAMILRGLFTELFERGIVMVITSNRPPDDLYKNGLQRKSFLPVIQLLKDRCISHSLDSGFDYRKQERELLPIYLPKSEKSTQALTELLMFLSKGDHIQPKELSFLGRTLVLPEYSPQKVAKISFEAICGESLSAADYLEVCKVVDYLILTDIPKLTLKDRNKARRFITLIDALYENKSKVFCSMEAPFTDIFSGKEAASPVDLPAPMLLEDMSFTAADVSTSPLFTGVEEIFAFQRCVSRLSEMQSVQWMQNNSELVKFIKATVPTGLAFGRDSS